MTKTKTIPLEIPAEWEFERATYVWMVSNQPNGSTILAVQAYKPQSWSWCESPTDEMAKLRPDCEVKDCSAADWHSFGRVLLAVTANDSKYFTLKNGSVAGWRFCRVRIDNATGKVIERWEE